MGVKIVAPGLESAVAGTSLHVIGPDDDEEELKDSVMEDMAVSRQTHSMAVVGSVIPCCVLLWPVGWLACLHCIMCASCSVLTD